MTVAAHRTATTEQDRDHWSIRLHGAGDPATCGGKAANLARIHALGLAVPSGFVITAGAFREFQSQSGIEELARRLRVNLLGGSEDAARKLGTEISARVGPASIPGDVRDAIVGPARELLAHGSLIVRSSAIGEDSARASFAGQLTSIRDVESIEALLEAVKQCWESYWSPSVLAYQRASGAELDGLALIVQVQVRSFLSGVLFTRSPDPQQAGRGLMLCEYCSGSGEALASGTLNPRAFLLQRADLECQFLTRQLSDAETGTGELTPELARELGHAALALEECFGAPQDIEWTLGTDGVLYVVQSRAVTGAACATSPSGQLWSNANINENFPEPASPLLYSIARDGYAHYFRNLGHAFGVSDSRLRSVDHALRNVIGIHGARLYYNVSNIHDVLRATPFGGWLGESFDAFVGTDGSATTSNSKQGSQGSSRALLSRVMELARVVFCTSRQYARISDRIRAFESDVDGFSARTDRLHLDSRNLAELHGDLLAFLDIRFCRWTNAGLADAAAMACSGLLLQLLRRTYPDDEAVTLQAALLTGLPDLVSRRPAEELWALADEIRCEPALHELFLHHEPVEIRSKLETDPSLQSMLDSLTRYLDRWGYRCSRELMLTTPSFAERPEDLIAILRMYVAMRADPPAVLLQRQRREREEATTRVLAVISKHGGNLVTRHLLAGSTSLLLRWTQKAIGLRERARLKQALIYGRFRQVALRIGAKLSARGTLAQQEDVFFLTYQELDSILSGTMLFPYCVHDLISLRRTEYSKLISMSPPDEFRLARGDYLDPEAVAVAPSIGRSHDESALRGLGVCPGTITARAAVLDDVSDASRLSVGDILVTRQTDPGWASVLYLVRGLVTERGGILSHGAIIAREFGIPAVVGVAAATQRVAHGDALFIDGGSGVVRVLD